MTTAKKDIKISITKRKSPNIRKGFFHNREHLRLLRNILQITVKIEKYEIAVMSSFGVAPMIYLFV